MSKAARLLRKNPTAKPKKKETPKVELDPAIAVNVPGRGPTALRSLARYWSILDRRSKALAAEFDVVKGALREAGKARLDAEAVEGRYYTAAKVGNVVVQRANKYRPVVYSREELIDAIGDLEYRTMFTESASIVFASADEMEQHLNACRIAGVEIPDGVSVTVKPRSSIRQRMAELQGALPEDVEELLTACSRDQAPSVGRAK